jgi:hypothetical protein
MAADGLYAELFTIQASAFVEDENQDGDNGQDKDEVAQDHPVAEPVEP